MISSFLLKVALLFAIAIAVCLAHSEEVASSSSNSLGDLLTSTLKSDDECAICLSNMDKTQKEWLICAHSFHKSCINRWKFESDSCPVCRTKLEAELVNEGANGASLDNSNEEERRRGQRPRSDIPVVRSNGFVVNRGSW